MPRRSAPDPVQQRVILHADMDAFYASVEQRDNPHLRGRPVAVGGPPPRGVVSAASYEARGFGVRSAMPMAEALQRCPDLVVPPPRMKKYSQISRQVFDIFRSYSPLVEPLSLDEAFVDLTGTARLHGPAPAVAHEIKQRVKRDLDLVVSVGVAPNKFLAKIASDEGKPDGLVVVLDDEVISFLHPLPVSRVFGVGKVTRKALSRLGIHTVGDLAAFPRQTLRARFGDLGEQLFALSHAADDRPVVPRQPPKTVGHEDTFAEDTSDLALLGQILLEQGDRVASRLRKEGYLCRTVVLKAKTARFELLTRRRALLHPACDGATLGRTAAELLSQLFEERGPLQLRLTGVTASQLIPARAPVQLCFEQPEHDAKARLGETLDAITDRFGQEKLLRASTLERQRTPDPHRAVTAADTAVDTEE